MIPSLKRAFRKRLRAEILPFFAGALPGVLFGVGLNKVAIAVVGVFAFFYSLTVLRDLRRSREMSEAQFRIAVCSIAVVIMAFATWVAKADSNRELENQFRVQEIRDNSDALEFSAAWNDHLYRDDAVIHGVKWEKDWRDLRLYFANKSPSHLENLQILVYSKGSFIGAREITHNPCVVPREGTNASGFMVEEHKNGPSTTISIPILLNTFRINCSRFMSGDSAEMLIAQWVVGSEKPEEVAKEFKVKATYDVIKSDKVVERHTLETTVPIARHR